MDGRLEHVFIQPSNIISTQSVSFKNGNPVLQFVIGEQDKYLIGSSVRLQGNIQFLEGSGTGVPPVSASNVCLDCKLGVYSVISQIDLFSQRTRQNCESIRHYNRFLSSFLPASTSKQMGMSHMNETALIFPNHEIVREGVVNNANGSAVADRQFKGNSFCISLPTGLLNSSEPIPLSSAGWGLGGLICEITLENDSQVLYSKDGNALTDCYYELSGLSLICELLTPSVDALSSLMSQKAGSLEYNSISSYYTSTNTTNSLVNFNLGTRKALSCFFNVIGSSSLNNTTRNGFACLPFLNSDGTVARLNQIVWTRGGVRFPNHYNIDTNIRDLVSTTEYNTCDPQVVRQALGSFLPFDENKNTQFGPDTINRNIPTGASIDDIANAGWMWCYGQSWDSVSNEGIDFGSVNLGIQMDVELLTDNPQTIFLFVRHKNTLVFNEGGLQVIS
jgi:hypothetical protein